MAEEGTRAPLPNPIEYDGPIDDMHVRHGTRLARRHCAECGAIIPDKYWSGFCRKHYAARRREQKRIQKRKERDRQRRAEGKPDREWSRLTQPRMLIPR